MSRWIPIETLLAAHDAQIAEHGGGSGIRHRGLLESAIARPQNLAAYGDPKPDAIDLAVAYATGIAHNHPFIDGNKRTALIALELFLNLNGYDLTATDADCVLHVLGIASRDESDEEFGAWVRAHVAKRGDA